MNDITQKGGLGSTNYQYNSTYNSPDIVRSPSIVADLIHALVRGGETRFKLAADDFEEYDIDEKLDHNKVNKYYELITDYTEYFLVVENAYQAVSEVRSNARESIMRAINIKYREFVGEIIKSLQIDPKDVSARNAAIQENSDALIEKVIGYVSDVCLKGMNSEKVSIEDVHSHSAFIVFHAFVECKVLEKPK